MATVAEVAIPGFRHEPDEHQSMKQLGPSSDRLDKDDAILSVPTATIYPAYASLTAIIDEYFLATWSFPSPSAAEKWRDEQHVLWVCYVYPFAVDDRRMDFACRLIVLLTLNDGTSIQYPRNLKLGRHWLAKMLSGAFLRSTR